MADKPAPKKDAKKKTDLKIESRRYVRVLRHHRVFIVMVVLLVVLLFVLLRVNMLSSMPADQAYITEQSSKSTVIRFDQETITKMKALKPSGVNVPGSHTDPGRTNPFGE